MSRARALLAAVPLLALTLGGCSGDPEPKFEPTPSAAPSASTPASAAPVLPAAAKERSDSGAEAFVRYWLEAVNYAQATGDTEALEGAALRSCTGCAGILKSIRAAYGAGGHIEGGDLSVGPLRKLPPDYGAEWAAFGRGRVAPQTVVESSGRQTKSTGGAFQLYAYLSWRDGWKLRWLRTPS